MYWLKFAIGIVRFVSSFVLCCTHSSTVLTTVFNNYIHLMIFILLLLQCVILYCRSFRHEHCDWNAAFQSMENLRTRVEKCYLCIRPHCSVMIDVIDWLVVCCVRVQLQQVNQCPLFVQLCLFNRLIRAMQYHLQIAQNKLHTNGNVIFTSSDEFRSL